MCSPAFLAGREIAPLAKPQHHVEKAEMRAAVGNGVVLATDGTNPNTAERENAGLHRRLADHFDDLAHIEAGIEIGRVFDREMRHVGITPTILRAYQAKEQADRAGDLSLCLLLGHLRRCRTAKPELLVRSGSSASMRIDSCPDTP